MLELGSEKKCARDWDACGEGARVRNHSPQRPGVQRLFVDLPQGVSAVGVPVAVVVAHRFCPMFSQKKDVCVAVQQKMVQQNRSEKCGFYSKTWPGGLGLSIARVPC
jgi:hypothetical protein